MYMFVSSSDVTRRRCTSEESTVTGAKASSSSDCGRAIIGTRDRVATGFAGVVRRFGSSTPGGTGLKSSAGAMAFEGSALCNAALALAWRLRLSGLSRSPSSSISRLIRSRVASMSCSI